MDPIEDGGAKELFQGQAHLYKLIFNNLSSMSLKCAVELSIADIIHSHGRPITLSELVSALHIQPAKANNLFSLMRLLVHTGLFSKTKLVHNQQEEEAYGLTPTSKLLIKDKSYCLSPLVLGLLDPVYVTSFHSLSGWFKGNDPTLFETVYGKNFWDFVDQNPGFGQRFNQAMASDSKMANLVVKDCKQIFEGLGSLVDVAGGTGSFSRIISEAFPGIKCTVLDLPHAVANMPETESLKYIAGDMFQFIPPADAYLFKMIFHGLGDENVLKILKKCREAIASNGERGKVIIIEIVINEKEDEHELTETKLLFDTLLTVNSGAGKERTEREWERLFLDAGFSHYKITPMFGIKSLIEVYPQRIENCVPPSLMKSPCFFKLLPDY